MIEYLSFDDKYIIEMITNWKYLTIVPALNNIQNKFKKNKILF